MKGSLYPIFVENLHQSPVMYLTIIITHSQGFFLSFRVICKVYFHFSTLLFIMLIMNYTFNLVFTWNSPANNAALESLTYISKIQFTEYLNYIGIKLGSGTTLQFLQCLFMTDRRFIGTTMDHYIIGIHHCNYTG